MRDQDTKIEHRAAIAKELAELLKERTGENEELQFSVLKIAILLLGHDWNLIWR